MTASVTLTPRQIGWLQGPSFDLSFVLGFAALGLCSGAIAVLWPSLFMPILLADLWLLGYHHVVATYTRLCFDWRSLQSHRFLVFALPLIVFVVAAGLVFGVGVWALVSVYFYWQWFHYARQSWGIGQAYRKKAEHPINDDPRLAQLIFYLVPLWGILNRSHQGSDLFLGLDIRLIPMPGLLVDAVGLAAIAGVAWWCWTRIQVFRQGNLPLAHSLYMITHFTIFFAAYVLIDDVSIGWLVINIWHNAQYIAFVWVFNSRRFAGRADPAAPFLSTISQPKHVALYLAICLSISTTLYFAIGTVAGLVLPPIVIYQAINFHHYVVDAVIWRSRPITPARRSA